MKFQLFAFRRSKLEIIGLILIATFLLLNSTPGEALWGKKTKEISGEELKKIKAELNIPEDPRFHPYGDPDLKEVLDKEIDSQEAPGLTYGVFILNAINEEKLVDMCSKSSFNDKEASRFFSILADNLTSWQKNFAEKTTKMAIEAIIEAYKMHGLSIGTSSLLLAVDLAQIGVGIMKLAELVRNRALWFYIGARCRGDSHEVAWSVAGIPPLYDNWQTQEFFKSLRNKYEKHMSEDGLDKDFTQQEREKLRISFLHSLGAQAHPVITAPLKITPPPYHKGDTINAEFTITNKGTAPIAFSILTVGGRDPDNRVADFTFRRDITLSPNKSYNYKGSLTLAKAGNYHFFCAYQTIDGHWNPSVDLALGLTDQDRIENIVVKVKGEAETIAKEKQPKLLPSYTAIIGFISSNTTWTTANSPYVTKGNILVKKGVTLTIEPGVTVKFGPRHNLIINGTLIAKGTHQQGIKFAAEQGTKPGIWGGIVFEDSSQGAKFDDAGNYVSGSMLQYCTLEFAKTAIKANSTSLFIAHSIIRNSGRISISEGEVLVIRNSRFADNNGIFVKNTRSLTLAGNIFTGNGDGGIYAEVGTTTITNNNFTKNNARNGGGAYIKCDNATIIDNTFTGNRVFVGWLQKGHGGGLYIEASMATITNNTFTKNLVTIGVGPAGVPAGGDSFGGGAYVRCDKATIENNNFVGNLTKAWYKFHGWGGGLYVKGGDTTITNNTFTENEALGLTSFGKGDGQGGGLYIEDSMATITNNIFTANKSSSYDRHGHPGGWKCGAGLYAIGGATSIINSTFISNEAAIGSAIYYSGSQKIANNFIANNAGAGEKNSNAVYIKGNPTFTGNTIIDNQTNFDLYYDQPKGSPNLNASNNYWGAATETEIRVKIHDFFADDRKAVVDVVPFLKSQPTRQSDLHPYIISEGHYEIGIKKTFSTHDANKRPIKKTLELLSADVKNDKIKMNIKVTFDEVEGYSPVRIGPFLEREAEWPNRKINTTTTSLSKLFKTIRQKYRIITKYDNEIDKTGLFASETTMKEVQKGKSYSGSFSFPLPQEGAFLPQENIYFKLSIDWPPINLGHPVPDRTEFLFRLCLIEDKNYINLSTPEDALVSFIKAFKQGDLKSLKKCSIIVDDDGIIYEEEIANRLRADRNLFEGITTNKSDLVEIEAEVEDNTEYRVIINKESYKKEGDNYHYLACILVMLNEEGIKELRTEAPSHPLSKSDKLGQWIILGYKDIEHDSDLSDPIHLNTFLKHIQ